MTLAKQYLAKDAEQHWMQSWQEQGIYQFENQAARPVYSIDTPPPTVSGYLHLGHVYSYSQTDFMARFWRMRGHNVFYPMGFDDNGLPTERLVEKRLKVRAAQIGRSAFIQKCLQVSEEAEKDYEALWKRLGLSIDWRYTYRTIEERARRISQQSFIDLYRRDLAYRQEAPAIWCPECQTSIAQAELNDLERESEFVTLDFHLEDGSSLPIATTRPELLPACVAVFVHPQDARYASLVGRQATVPLIDRQVPILADPGADPEKGTGAVMCCTFGDTTDVAWWRTHQLPLIPLVQRDGRLGQAAGVFANLSMPEARQQIQAALQAQDLILDRQPTRQSIRVHERCDTPVEYVLVSQWFIRVLDFKDRLVEAGEQVAWHPEHMQARYRAWVENLNWDWCISRQRFYGVTFPLWYCRGCGQVILADDASLPVDPSESQPGKPCPACGSTDFTPETDIMDTWATSSLSPQIAGHRGAGGETPLTHGLYERVFPFSLRPQAHEIIRTWAFYTLTKSMHHFGALPWQHVAISGWGLAGEGMGKISKSRGGGPMAPLEMIQRYSADALRYWAASTGPGKDAVISEEKIQMGAKLVTKLWNVARFSERFLEGAILLDAPRPLSPADQWILARLQHLVRQATNLLVEYDYAAAKAEVESFFWRDLADNYLEMCKQRLYDPSAPQRPAAVWTLYQVLLTVIKLFAPFFPYITEEIYQGLFAGKNGETATSIHTSAWPVEDPALVDPSAEANGEALLEIATAVRRYRSENNLSLGLELVGLRLVVEDPALAGFLELAAADLRSICRVQECTLATELPVGWTLLLSRPGLQAALNPQPVEKPAASG